MLSFQNRQGQGEDAGARRLGTMEIVALAMALLWLIAVAGLVFRGGLGGEGGGVFAALAGVMAVVMPVAMIAMVVSTARQIRALRDEAEEIRAEILRLQAGGPLSAAPSRREEPPRGPEPRRLDDHPRLAEPARLPDPVRTTEPPRMAEPPRREEPEPAPPFEMAAAAPRAEERPHRPAPARPAPPDPAPVDEAGEALTIEDYITALNFPDSPDDAEGIRALHRALADEPTAKLIRAAQDVLTLLADDGVFMDDLPVDPAPPPAWRRLARDGRGAALGPMGALISPQVFDRVAGRMAADQVFHDAAHHFLRQFDRSLSSLAAVGGDGDLAALGETRTARAFLLLGRVANSMD